MNDKGSKFKKTYVVEFEFFTPPYSDRPVAINAVIDGKALLPDDYHFAGFLGSQLINVANKLFLDTDENSKITEKLEKQRIEKARSKTRIYLMIDDNTGYYKIGRSRRPIERESTLQSEKPTIRLLHHWEDTPKGEISLHKKFEHKRIRGEWFDLSTDDIKWILENKNI